MSIVFRFIPVFVSMIFLLGGCKASSHSYIARDSRRAIRVGPVEVSIRSYGRNLPTFVYRGSHYVLGRRGVAYSIYIRNRTNRRLEVVVAVDGRDVINGRRSNVSRDRGYILNGYRYVNITGYRTSKSHVATFRFSSIGNSYAARRGSSWFRVGHIRVSVFRERRAVAYIPRPLIQRRYKSRHHGAPSTGGAKRSAPKSAVPHDNDDSGEVGRSRSARRRYHRHYRRHRRIWRPRPRNRPNIGTAYGHRRYAPAEYTTFRRATSYPSYGLTIRYNDCAGYRRSHIYLRWCPCNPCRRPLIQRHKYTPPPNNGGYAPPPSYR